MRYDRIFEALANLTQAPRPSWKILLSPDGLSRWTSWAQKYMRARMQNKKAVGAMDDTMVSPWCLDTMDDFIHRYGEY